ncbi:MAG TPA: VWA domain-containing protein [Vicinamibacteria bacterium]|nr:VWA domain-containing protein [Vicinamibacteria bacterium]
MIFASPSWLLALLLLPLGAVVFGWLARRDRERLGRLVSRPLWGRVVRRSRERWRWLRLALLLAGAMGVIVALARPQWGMVREKVGREGVDVVLLLDTSASMATPDVAPSRLFLARQALMQLVARLDGDRFALVAFEREAYPLVPLTLDPDVLGLFLDTVEPGMVPAPGTSLGSGLSTGLSAFVDKDRRHKVMVLVSDGEDLEGEVEAAVRAARQAGVIVHTVGVGTEAGQPVPELDADGRVIGYKRDEGGNPVVSRLNMQNLEAIARGTGGQAFRITPADTSLSRLAGAIEGLEQKALTREFSYRRKERFQAPLAAGLLSLTAGLLLPLPHLRRRGRPDAAPRGRAVGGVAALLVLLLPALARGQELPSPAASPSPAAGSLLDELLLRPRRATAEGRADYDRGNHPRALSAFERAAASRPRDLAVRFNVADGLYKNGRYDEAAALFRALGQAADSPVAAAARYNLGNSLFQKQDYRGAADAYRQALELRPSDEDTRRNLELALRALQERQQNQAQGQKRQEKEQRQERQQPQSDMGQRQEQKLQGRQQGGQDAPREKRQDPQPREAGGGGRQTPQAPEERADQRFREQAGMPRERAMQLLDALQQNEREEQKKQLQRRRAATRQGKDW